LLKAPALHFAMKLAALWWLTLGVTSTLGSLLQERGGVIVPQPQFVVPDRWATDRSGKFLLLPLSVSEGLSLDECKVLTDGSKILVVVSEQPQEQPETAALRKYRLIVEALKVEAGHDEHLLQSKYLEWLDTEEDEEVQAYVRSAYDSLRSVQAAKNTPTARTVAVPLGVVQSSRPRIKYPMYPSSVLQLRGTSTPGIGVPRLAIGKAAAPAFAEVKEEKQLPTQSSGRSMVRESFAVAIPYPAPPESCFLLRASATLLIVAMPLDRHSLGAQGISTGGVPFVRAPVFDESGRHLAGPRDRDVHKLAAGLDMSLMSSPSNFVALAA